MSASSKAILTNFCNHRFVPHFVLKFCTASNITRILTLKHQGSKGRDETRDIVECAALTSCWPWGPQPAYCSWAFRTSGGFKFHASLGGGQTEEALLSDRGVDAYTQRSFAASTAAAQEEEKHTCEQRFKCIHQWRRSVTVSPLVTGKSAAQCRLQN